MRDPVTLLFEYSVLYLITIVTWLPYYGGHVLSRRVIIFFKSMRIILSSCGKLLLKVYCSFYWIGTLACD